MATSRTINHIVEQRAFRASVHYAERLDRIVLSCLPQWVQRIAASPLADPPACRRLLSLVARYYNVEIVVDLGRNETRVLRADALVGVLRVR